MIVDLKVPCNLSEELDAIDKQMCSDALSLYPDSLESAGKALGMCRTNLYYKIKKYGLSGIRAERLNELRESNYVKHIDTVRTRDEQKQE